MAHEFETGFFVTEPAWHGLGTVLQDPPTIAEALADAGLNWRVETQPLILGAELSGPVSGAHELQRIGTMNANETPKSDNVTRTAEENAARWSDETDRKPRPNFGGTVPHREKRFYGSIGNP